MKAEQINEGNRLIAEFMGIAFDNTDPFWYNDQKYHISWNWLMPVVAKVYEYANLGSEERQKVEESLLGIIDIEDTWNAVVDYLEWHKLWLEEQEAEHEKDIKRDLYGDEYGSLKGR